MIFLLSFSWASLANEQEKLQSCFNNITSASSEAVLLCKQLLKDDTNSISLNDRSRIYLELSSLANASGQYMEAESLLDKALEENAFLKEDNFYRYNWIRTKGAIQFKQEQFENALPFMQEGLRIAKKLKVEGILGTSANDVASTYMELGRYNKAMQFYEQSLAVFTGLDNQYSMAISLAGIGIAHKDLGDYETAVNFLNRSISARTLFLSDNENNSFAIADLNETKLILAQTHVLLGQYILAGSLLEEARQFYQGKDKKSELAAVYAVMSQIATAKKEHSLALSYVQKANEIEVSNGLHLSLLVQEQLAVALLSNNKRNAALNIALQGLDNAIEQKHFQTQLFFLKWLGDFYVGNGDFQSSQQYFSDYLTIYESFLDTKYDPAVADLKAVIEVKQQQQDIAKLELESQLSAYRVNQQRWIIGITLTFSMMLAFACIVLFRQKVRQKIALEREINMHRNELIRLAEQDQTEAPSEAVIDAEDDEEADSDDYNTSVKLQNAKPDQRLYEFHQQLVELMCLSCEFWEQSTGLNQIELAERSAIWLVVIDEGRLRTRTMDKYLAIQRLPKKPRWRQVVRTCRYVLIECNLSSPQRDVLNAALEKTLATHRMMSTSGISI